MKEHHCQGNIVPQCDDNVSDAEILNIFPQLIHSAWAGTTAGPLV